MKTFTHIVVPTDFSATARDALVVPHESLRGKYATASEPITAAAGAAIATDHASVDEQC